MPHVANLEPIKDASPLWLWKVGFTMFNESKSSTTFFGAEIRKLNIPSNVIVS